MFYGVDGEKVTIETNSSNDDFHFCAGIGVGVEDFESFKEDYYEVIERVLGEEDIDYDRRPLKAAQIKRKAKFADLGKGLVDRIVEEISNHIDEIYLIFTTLRGQEQVKSYNTLGGSELPVFDFFNTHLGPAYEHICAWRLLEENHQHLYLDAFEGHRTNAWDRVVNNRDNVSMLYNGDKVNPLISTSDMVLEKLKRDTYDQGIRIYKDSLKDYLDSNFSDVSVEYLGSSLLGVIVPQFNDPMTTFRLVEHPVFFIMRPKKEEIEKSYYLNCPQGQKILKKAANRGGCVKFYDEDSDRDLIKENDKIIYFDENEEKANTLRKLGHQAEFIKFNEI